MTYQVHSSKIKRARTQSRIYFAFWFFLIASLAACSKTNLPTNIPPISSIRVVMDNNYPPYAFLDAQGNMQGISVDQWKLWEERTGVKVEIVGRPWGEALEGMKSGEFDVIDTIFYTEERAKNYDFTEPYADITVNIFFDKNISGIARVEDLKGFRVAAKSGDANAEYLIEHGISGLAYYDNYEDIVLAAAKHEESIFVIDQPPALYYLYKLNIQDQFNYSKPLYGGAFHRAVKKGNAELLDLVNKGFASISDSEYKAIDERWFGTQQVAGLDRIMQYLGGATALALLIISILFVFNRTLQTQVKVRTHELEQALQNLDENRAFLADLIENSGALIYVKDLSGRYELVNRKWEEATGLKRETAIGAKDEDLFPGDTGRQFRTNDLNVMQAAKLMEMDEILDSIHGPRHFLVIKFPLHDSNGIVKGMCGMATEITERKWAEEALQESERRERERATELQTIMDSVPAAVSIAHDRLCQVVTGNRTLYDMLRVPPQSNTSLTAPADQQLAHFKIHINGIAPPPNELPLQISAATGVEIRNIEEDIVFDDGRAIHLLGNIVPLLDEQGLQRGAVAAFVDITERKKAEKKLSEQLDQLQLLRAIDLAIVSSADLNSNLQLIVRKTTERLHVDASAILLLDSKTQTLSFAAGEGFHTNALQFTHLEIGEGTAGYAAQEQRIVHIPNLQETQDNPTLTRAIKGEGFIAYYGIPLIAKDKLLGVLEIFHRFPLDPDPDWLSFLETLAGQASISIDEATLFSDLQKSNTELEQAYDATLEGWSHALDLRDKETEGHTRRVTEVAVKLAHAMNLNDEEILHIKRGALLHDIGKMGIPDSILLKPSQLTEEEWDIMRKHPVYARDMLSRIEYLRPALDIPYCHHERWDGKGYPQGLKGEDIPLAARIFAIVDVWDALSMDRPYRKGWSKERIFEFIQSKSGVHFDPHVAEVFLGMVERDGI